MKQKPNPSSTQRILLSSILASALFVGLPQPLRAGINATQTIQQAGMVNGRVVDANGEAIIGATIKVVGTQEGTVTDLDGNYTVKAKSGDLLEISYVGYKPQTVKAGSGSARITLIENSQNLNEVVVVGFGTQKKVNLTGAVAVVKGDELAQRPVQSAAQALQGVVPGLQISSSSGGSLDSNPSINVRGTATIGEGSKVSR